MDLGAVEAKAENLATNLHLHCLPRTPHTHTLSKNSKRQYSTHHGNSEQAASELSMKHTGDPMPLLPSPLYSTPFPVWAVVCRRWLIDALLVTVKRRGTIRIYLFSQYIGHGDCY